MKIYISNEKLEHNQIEPFLNTFDKVYVSVDNNFEEINQFQLSEKNISKFFDTINYSWDGSIFIFEKKDEEKVLGYLNKWFLNSDNHWLSGENGIKNCLLIKYSKNKLVIIDTQRDMGSTFDIFIKDMMLKTPEIKNLSFSDCHLTENMYLGREINKNEFEFLYTLYKENLINEAFFLRGFEAIGESESGDKYFDIVSKEKPIVITGKLAIDRDELEGYLADADFNISNRVTKDTWLWYGKKAGKSKVSTALEKGAMVSAIDEVINKAYNQYIINMENER